MWEFAEEVQEIVLPAVLFFKWSVKKHWVAKILLAVWEKFIYENHWYYNSAKLGYKLDFIPFLSFHRKTKWKSNFKQLAVWCRQIFLYFVCSYIFLGVLKVRYSCAKFHHYGVSPKLLSLNRDQPSKKWFFSSNPYKVNITSVIDTLELPNFGHMTTSTIWFESGDKVLLVTSWAEIMTP